MAFKNASHLDVPGIAIKVDSAYHKVSKVIGDKESINVYVEISKEKEEQPFKVLNYLFKPDVDELSFNFIKQAYLHLKTLPEFADAIDC